MTVRTIHILTEEGDSIPSTGDPIAVLHLEEPLLFFPGRGTPAKKLSAAEVKALRTAHELAE